MSFGVSQQLVFVSRFAEGDQGGVQAFRFDVATGELAPSRQNGDGKVFFLTASDDGRRLYGLRAGEGGEDDEMIAWEIADTEGNLRELGRARTGGHDSCHAALDPTGSCLFVANYTGGTLAIMPLNSDGSPKKSKTLIQLEGSSLHPRQKGPHPHALIFAGAAKEGKCFAYATDLGSDRIWGFAFDLRSNACEPLDPPFCSAPPGAGPRHFVLHPTERWLYAANELSNSVTVYERQHETGVLLARQTVGVLPNGFVGESHAGDIAISPNGRFVYVTNRGHDSIAVLAVEADGRLALQGVRHSGGRGPQSIVFAPCGRWLLCAHLQGSKLTVNSVETGSGLPQTAVRSTDVMLASSIVMVVLKRD